MGVQVGKPGTKYVRLEIDFWFNPKDRSIRIADRDGDTLISTVNDEPGSIRPHPNLYRKLKALLIENDRWPEGA